jgi:RNA polymerase sigma-70 factor (ECF subfamily)
VAAAGAQTTIASRQALATLCEQYWYPLYAFIRRRGHPRDEAEDLTQAFFAMLLEKNTLKHADPQRGRFRSYLLGTLRNFLANEWDRSQAIKRGGGRKPVSMDAASAEGRLGIEPHIDQSPEHFFDRQWALTVLNLAMELLRIQSRKNGKEAIFDRLQTCLVGEESELNYQQIGDELGMTEGAVKVAVYRLRAKYRELIREQIAQTLDSQDEIDDEIRHLFEALRG